MTFLILLAVFERLVKFALVEFFFQRQPPPPPADSTRRVSILQPILSGDPTLWDCLRANLRARTGYHVEWLWLVDDNDAEGIAGCQRLIAEFPDQNIRLLLLPPPPDGVNPKTLKLIAGADAAHGEIIVVLDDDTMLPDNGLEICLPYLDSPGVGLAFGLPYYQNFSNIWSALVASFVNANSLLTYVPYTFVTKPLTINGMFYAITRTVLDAVGGFAGLENQLCDDYAVANRIRQHGYTLQQTPLRHAISTTIPDFTAYLRLLNRWFIFPQVSIMSTARPAELVVFYTLIVVPTFFPLVVTLMGAAFPALLPLVALYWLVNAAVVFTINARYCGRISAWLLPIQLIAPLHIIRALLSPKEIIWRGHRIRVLPSNQIHYIRRKTDSV